MAAGTPLISLVICTYNREKFLPQALESIRQQQFPASDFELVIIDNNSTDNTAAISKKFIADNPNLTVRYFFETNKGLSFARNRGLKEAAAPVLSYIDDDVILSPAYLQEMAGFFSQHPNACGAGGKVIPKYESGQEPPWMSKYLAGFVGKVDYGTAIKQYDQTMKYPAGCNMTYTKDILTKAGGFNNDLTFRSDDKYIFFKVKEQSAEIYYLPGAYLHHYIDAHRVTFDNFRKLFLKTGNEEKIRVRQEKGTAGLLRKFAEYTVKLGASFVLYFLFLLKGQEIKGRYVIFSQWFTLKGFLSSNVFVR
ncbi:MAG: glycosyltransferase [Bacteroidota bacterium]